MARAFDAHSVANDHEPHFDRYLLERRDRPLAVLLSDGRRFVLHAVAREAENLEGRRFHSVSDAERALDRVLQGVPANTGR